MRNFVAKNFCAGSVKRFKYYEGFRDHDRTDTNAFNQTNKPRYYSTKKVCTSKASKRPSRNKISEVWNRLWKKIGATTDVRVPTDTHFISRQRMYHHRNQMKPFCKGNAHLGRYTCRLLRFHGCHNPSLHRTSRLLLQRTRGRRKDFRIFSVKRLFLDSNCTACKQEQSILETRMHHSNSSAYAFEEVPLAVSSLFFCRLTCISRSQFLTISRTDRFGSLISRFSSSPQFGQ